MLSFHVKFVTDGWTDNGKTISPLSFDTGGIKILHQSKFKAF